MQLLYCVVYTEHTENTESLPWPPTGKSLQKRLAFTPALLQEFFRSILASEDTYHLTAKSTKRLTEFFAQDFMFGISRGTFLTLKHTCLGLGFHNMVGQKLPIIILSHLGQSITYHTVRDIETAQAEVLKYYSKSGMTLLIQPKNPESSAPTIFWWDNFDRFVDAGTGVDPFTILKE